MITEGLISTATSIGGGFFIGLLLGYFVKKIIKIIMFVAGAIVGLLLLLHHQQIISINLDKLEESSNFIFTSILSSFNNVTQIGDTTSLGIPMVGGLSAGFAIGLMKG
jgi:uncharacterized membrane protein (Fun14 family)